MKLSGRSMSDGNSGMKICPLGNTQEMFKPQIRSYPIKIYAVTSLISKLNRPNREFENIWTTLQLRHFAVIHVSQCHFSNIIDYNLYVKSPNKF